MCGEGVRVWICLLRASKMALSKKRGTFTPTDPHREASGKAGGGSSVCVKLLDGTVLTYSLVDVSSATEYSSRYQHPVQVLASHINKLSLACILHCGYGLTFSEYRILLSTVL